LTVSKYNPGYTLKAVAQDTRKVQTSAMNRTAQPVIETALQATRMAQLLSGEK
jgi:hypothetical protein